MAAKPLDFHPEALEEWKSAVAQYLERNETAAVDFVAEVDQAIDLIAASPQRWPKGLHGTRKFVSQRFSFAVVYPRERNRTASPGNRSRAQASRILEKPALGH
jgi:plasmid stabilization system protein ParE